MMINNIAVNVYEKIKNNQSYQLLLAGGLILAIVAFFIFFVDSDISQDKTILIKDLYGYLNVWDNQADLWGAIQIILSIGAVFASLSLTAFPKMRSENQVRGLAFVAALSTGFITTFEPGNISNAYREGWRELNVALLVCKAEPKTNKCTKELVTAYEKGEKLIGRNYIAPPTEINGKTNKSQN